LLHIYVLFDVLPLVGLQMYGAFFSSVPRPHTTFDWISLGTSLYMDTLPLVSVWVFGLGVFDVVRVHWPHRRHAATRGAGAKAAADAS
jgi:hypothetical protein